MPDLASDEFWREYVKASEDHRRAMLERMDASRELAERLSEDTLERWNTASREEDWCYEQLKAAERVVWAKHRRR